MGGKGLYAPAFHMLAPVLLKDCVLLAIGAFARQFRTGILHDLTLTLLYPI